MDWSDVPAGCEDQGAPPEPGEKLWITRYLVADVADTGATRGWKRGSMEFWKSAQSP